jgi:hypothetical protein
VPGSLHEAADLIQVQGIAGGMEGNAPGFKEMPIYVARYYFYLVTFSEEFPGKWNEGLHVSGAAHCCNCYFHEEYAPAAGFCPTGFIYSFSAKFRYLFYA